MVGNQTWLPVNFKYYGTTKAVVQFYMVARLLSALAQCNDLGSSHEYGSCELKTSAYWRPLCLYEERCFSNLGMVVGFPPVCARFPVNKFQLGRRCTYISEIFLSTGQYNNVINQTNKSTLGRLNLSFAILSNMPEHREVVFNGASNLPCDANKAQIPLHTGGDNM